ncbi:MAG: ArsR family transcriptional regulator [Phycisphaeraceae bacterium]|nr:ArsR family transcriptional regulator [Phycisphaeraceae bacterium]MCW5764087.1 ArsR family transcriptional regulator [Phycisphaeraceae bacterium]
MKPGAVLAPVIDRLTILCEPARLRALRVLEREELSVGELARVLQAPQSTVSRHLKLLSDAGWVLSRTERTATYYRVVPGELPEADRELWTVLSTQIDDRGELAEDSRRLESVLAERQTDSLSFFGRVAGEWDALRRELFGDQLTEEALLGLIRPDWVIVDVGCGTGNAAAVLAPIAQRVIAVDQSAPMLEAARRRIGEEGTVEFRLGSAEALPLESGEIDAAVCLLVLHHVEDLAAAAKELRRVLRSSRSGGGVLIVDMYEHERSEFRHRMGHRHQGFDPALLAQVFQEAGFKSVRTRPLSRTNDGNGPGLFALAAWI